MVISPVISAPIFSIITPVYNGGIYFEKLIQSITSQSEKSVEHIVIDDGSSDAITLATLQKYPQVKWWAHENIGQYYSMNEGLEKATGDWVCFINADDLLAPGALSAVKSIINENSALEMVWGKGCFIREDGSIYEVQNTLQRFIGLHKYLTQVPHSAIYVKRHYLLDKKLRFDSNKKFKGDYFWINKLNESRPKKKFINYVLSNNRIHSGQTTNTKRNLIKEEQDQLRQEYKRSRILYGIAKSIKTLRSASIRIIYKIKTEGFNAGFDLLMSFFRNR
jgi:glycosyltransferase involved in cell wall biosynthesis